MMAESNGMAASNNAEYSDNHDDSRLIELVGFLVQGVVDHPEEVEVEEFFDDIGSVYGVRVHPDDVGRVIGREGRVAGALRYLVKAAAVKTGEHVTVEILTDDSPLAQLHAHDEENAEHSADSGEMPVAEETPQETPVAPESLATPEAPSVEQEPLSVEQEAPSVEAEPAAETTKKPTVRGVRASNRRGMMPRGGEKIGNGGASEGSSGD